MFYHKTMERYYYVGNGNQVHGPVLPSEFISLGLTPNTLVCTVGEQEWVRIADKPELAQYMVPPIPNQQHPYGSQPPYSNQPPYQGQPQYQQPPYQGSNNINYPPNNNLVWAILSTVCCCLPFGMYAIVCAAQVNGLWARGQYEEAYRKANAARQWSIYGAIVGVVGSILYMLLSVLTIGY